MTFPLIVLVVSGAISPDLNFTLRMTFIVSHRFVFLFHYILKCSQFPSGIQTWLYFHPEESCSAFMSLYTFCCFRYFWYPTLTHGGQIGYRMLHLFSYTCWDLHCVLICGWFWRKLHGLMRRKSILYSLGGELCICLIGTFGLLFNSPHPF